MKFPIRYMLTKLRTYLYYTFQNLFNKNTLSYEETYNFLLNRMKYIVQSGPFKGMKYINRSNGSALFPKIAGIYEHGIQGIIESIINTNYTNYIDIGSAEGYYAVGIAYRVRTQRQNFKVFAYDTDPDAILNLNSLAKTNGVSGLLEIGNNFKTSDFDRFDGSTVVICDIEGDEIYLLDPSKSQNLLKFDLLVEVHDGGSESNFIKDCLRERFSSTHTIEIFHHIDYSKRVFPSIDFHYEKQLMNEGRKYGLEWMWLKVKK